MEQSNPYRIPQPNTVQAMLAFKGGKCLVGINALISQTGFAMVGDRILADTGQELLWPDEPSRRRALELFAQSPSNVFVVEFGPMGPIAEHQVRRGS